MEERDNLSVPSSVNVGPFTSLVMVKKRYIIFYLVQIWFSFFVMQYEFWWYWSFLYYGKYIHFITFFPLLVFVMYVTLVFVSLISAKILLLIVNIFHKPREGIFLRDASDKDYRYWSIRNTIKKWPIWLSHKFPLPFLDNLCFKMFSVKTTFANSLFEGWCDCEMVSFGKNVVLGQSSIVQSAVIVGNLFIMRRTTIEDNVHIGAHSIVMPGTHVGKNCILSGCSLTTIGQKLEEGWVYVGAPCKKYKKNVFFEDGLEDKLGILPEEMEKLHELYEDLYLKRKDRDITEENDNKDT
jgi:hypothetical protein